MNETAQHPIWAEGVSEAIRDEYRMACEQRDKYLSWHQRADSEAERYASALEMIAALDVDHDDPLTTLSRAMTIASEALPQRS